MSRRAAAIAAASLVPPLAYELVELKKGPDGWPFTRYVLILPRWVIAVLLGAAFVVLWDHFINHD